MNRPDERAPRARREVPTGRALFGFLLALIALATLAQQVVEHRFALFAWWLTLPSWAFVAMAAVGVALAAAAIVVAFAVRGSIDAGSAEDYAAVADLPPEGRP